MIKSLKDLNFDNRALKCLPIDSVKENYVRTVNNACFSLVEPTKLENPKLVCYSSSALQLLDLNEQSIDDYFIECFAGNTLIPGSETAAHCYCGHQFGIFAGQLGDGAAIYLGEIVNSKNEHWELQLKGAGPTPYSRSADGRKVLRSSLREFLCSEAMHHLNIATTRSATCIVSDTKVERDQFYDGHPKMENCAVISRIAQSFIRFGSFEIIRDSNSSIHANEKNKEILLTLVNYVLECLFPKIHQLDASLVEKCKLFYRDVVINTAKLVAGWQAVGFVHGVLNTDNMSILGLTLDYGPFGFMDRFDPDHIPNTSDHEGRYRFKKQPRICEWNLLKFAEVLEPLVPLSDLKTILQDLYQDTYEKEYMNLMLKKLGLFQTVPKNIIDDQQQQIICDKELIDKFLETMDKVGGDYTNCFRNLNLLTIPELDGFEESLENLKNALMEQSSDLMEMKLFYQNYINSPMIYMKIILLQNFRDNIEDDESIAMLKRLKYYQRLKELQPEQFSNECHDSWKSWLDLYINRIKFEIKNFKHDSQQLIKYNLDRKKMMNSINPCFILRNHLAQDAIEKAENGDFSQAKQLLKILEQPFEDNSQFDSYKQKPPKSSCSIRVSCSS